jgi:hypothetical protein
MFRIHYFGKLVVFAIAFLLSPLTLGLAASAEPMPSPILAFSFDNVTSSTVPDDSMSGNTYSIAAYSISGPFTPTTVDSFTGSGKAMQFDGTQQQRIEVNGTALTVSGFTFMADISLTGNDTDPAHERWEISEKAGSYWGNIRYGPPRVLRVGGFFSGSQTNSFTGSVPIPTSTWTNVAFIFDPSGHKLQTYVNGALDHEQIQNGTLDPSITHNGIDENLVVGAKHRLGGAGEVLEAFFDGLMDNYRLYNVALTGTEVATIAGVPVTPATPVITEQPRNRKVTEGQTATFGVAATGDPPLTYQWLKGGAVIDGATQSRYITPPTTSGDNGALYSVIVTNPGGSVTSNEAKLSVLFAPIITDQPHDASVKAGRSATFRVTAIGTAPLTYQWQKNGIDISGATSRRYLTPPTTPEDNGSVFAVKITNSLGTVTSNNATLTVR